MIWVLLAVDVFLLAAVWGLYVVYQKLAESHYNLTQIVQKLR